MEEKRMWGDKRYHSLGYYLKNTFGEKLYKLSLNGGMTCPNRDGTLGTGGCIFCSGGSGEYASDRNLSIPEQIKEGKSLLSFKAPDNAKYIAYFQAYTNTYAPVSYLRKIFTEAACHPDVAVVSIATRPDCLGPEVLSLLEELNRIKPVWIELGLQTANDITADKINRGYPLSCFETALAGLRGIRIPVVVHVILGLPGETPEDMFRTVSYLAQKPIQGIKLQLLHVLKNTRLAEDFHEVPEMTPDSYALLVSHCIGMLPQRIIIHRITGDGPKNLLLSPLWSADKKRVLNKIHHTMKELNVWQGKYYKEEFPCSPMH